MAAKRKRTVEDDITQELFLNSDSDQDETQPVNMHWLEKGMP